jgi:transcriptional regulator with XRE-family HTH domain
LTPVFPERNLIDEMNMHPARRYRKLHGLTLRQLGDVVEATGATISRIENGLQKPSLALLQRFVDRTGLRAEDFLRQEAAE